MLRFCSYKIEKYLILKFILITTHFRFSSYKIENVKIDFDNYTFQILININLIHVNSSINFSVKEIIFPNGEAKETEMVNFAILQV